MGSISVSYHQILPSAHVSKKADLRIRDIPEWQSAVIFDPDQADLRMINMTSRLIIELCDGRVLKEIEQQYCDLLSKKLDRGAASEQFRIGLQTLHENDLLTIK